MLMMVWGMRRTTLTLEQLHMHGCSCGYPACARLHLTLCNAGLLTTELACVTLGKHPAACHAAGPLLAGTSMPRSLQCTVPPWRKMLSSCLQQQQVALRASERMGRSCFMLGNTVNVIYCWLAKTACA